MWPFRKKGTGRNPVEESKNAMEQAQKNLEESLKDRRDVQQVTAKVRHELTKNHISQRIEVLLREGQ